MKKQLFESLLTSNYVVDLWLRTDLPTDTILPSYLMGRDAVQLQYGLNLPVQIRDLYIGEGAVTGTLSFAQCGLAWTRACWVDVFMISILDPKGQMRGQVFDEEYAQKLFARVRDQQVGRPHRSGFRVIDGGRASAPSSSPTPKGAA